MKKAGAFMASVAAASSMALQPPAGSSTSASPDAGRLVRPSCCSPLEAPESSTTTMRKVTGGMASGSGAPEKDRYAPRFDGLRFIETLVTAHR